MAHQAWKALSPTDRTEAVRVASEAADDPFGVSQNKAYDHWRKTIQQEVTGKSSMRDMVNDDYNLLRARWLWIMGRQGDSLRATAASTEEGERRLRYKIQQAAESHGLPHPAYAEQLSQDKFGKRLALLDEAQLTQVIATINNRGRHSNRRKTAKPKIDKNVKQPDRGRFNPPTQPELTSQDGSRLGAYSMLN